MYFSPLIKIGLMYVEEAAGDTGELRGIGEAGDAISRLICGTCPYAEVAGICHACVGTSMPAHRVQTIINIGCGCRGDPPPIPRRLSKRFRLWNHTDDIRLLAGLWRYGIGDWKRISQFVGNGKTSAQCSQRWSRALNPALSKEPWTEDEDRALLEFVGEYGEHSWARVAKQVGSRSDVQCRYRFELLQKMKKESERRGKPLRLVNDPFQLSDAELMPPLILREQGGRPLGMA
jgi:hypothetical protein